MRPRISVWSWPWVTLAIAAADVAAFVRERQAEAFNLLAMMMHDYALDWPAFLHHPGELFPTLVSHTFLHANIDHLVGNVVFFLAFAPAVENALGPLFLLIGYFVWGIGAAVFQGFFTPYSGQLIGASGCISGVMGAFFVLYPLRMPNNWIAGLGRWTGNHKVETVGRWVARIPAFAYVGLWFLIQLKQGVYSVLPNAEGTTDTVAHWAHVGGFFLGALSALPFVSRPAKNALIS